MKPMRRSETGTIIENREAAPCHFLMKLELPLTFGSALPGQFVMIKTGPGEAPLLARPFSIYGMAVLEEKIRLEILYRIAGKGTDLMSRLVEGNRVGVLGPLGKGFRIEPHLRKAALVAGGVGVAPLAFLSAALKRRAGACEATCYIGARTGSALVGLERIEASCRELKVATDDGSRGFHGMVTALFEGDLGLFEGEDAAVFVCGPRPMMRAMAGLAEGRSLRCQASLEERMACGMGACLGCAVKGKSIPGFLRVCTDGPVFDIQEIDWNE